MMMTIRIGVANQTEMHKINTTLKSRDRQTGFKAMVHHRTGLVDSNTTISVGRMDGWMDDSEWTQAKTWMDDDVENQIQKQ